MPSVWYRRRSILPRTFYCLHKLEGKSIVLNIFNALQNLFTRNNDVTNIVGSKLCTGVYGGHSVMTRVIFVIKRF
jgi:predicted HAD superfamily phosphohydrolase YqeG